MQTDLFLVGDRPAPLSRALLDEWARQAGRAFLLLREWPRPAPVEGDPAFDGVLMLTWPQDAPAPVSLGQALAMNYDMSIDGVLFQDAAPWEGADVAGIASNLQPHGGSEPVYLELGLWLSERLGMPLVDPVFGRWEPAAGRFAALTGWRRVFDGALANPDYAGD